MREWSRVLGIGGVKTIANYRLQITNYRLQITPEKSLTNLQTEILTAKADSSFRKGANSSPFSFEGEGGRGDEGKDEK
jgi:hypothetical protein